jgi:flavin-binding protein dodecin
MSDHVYKTIEITGTSTASVEDAVGKAVAKASKTVHNLRWFQLTEVRGSIDHGKVGHWQVSMKLGFTLED